MNPLPLLALLALPQLALGWEPGDILDLPGTGDAAVLHVAQLNGAPALLAAGPGGVFLVQGGTILASDSRSASDATYIDHAVWACSEAGILKLGLASDGFEQGELVSTEPCTALTALERGEERAPWLLSAHTSLGLWRVSGAKLVGPSRLGNRIDGHPILASQGDQLAAVGQADTTVVTRRGLDRSDLPTGGRVGALALANDEWVWSLPRSSSVALASGAVLTVDASPRGIAAADLDGDGVQELLVAHPRSLGSLDLRTGEETLWPLDFPPMAIAAADFDGDACVDVAVLGANTTFPSLLRGRCTGNLAPVASTGELLLQRHAWPELRVVPGDTVNVDLRWPGQPNEDVSLRGAPERVALDAGGHLRFEATLDDVGQYAISARTVVSEQLLGGFFLTIVDPSKPPTPLPPRAPEPERVRVALEAPALPALQAVVGQTIHLRLQHPRAELYAVLDGPPGLVARPDGRVDFAPAEEDEGTWEVVVGWWEDDSQHTDRFQLTVHPSAQSTPTHSEPAGSSAASSPPLFQPTPWACTLGLGAAGSISGTRGPVHDAGMLTLTSSSAAYSVGCATGSAQRRYYLGVDRAPGVAFYGPEPSGIHVVALTAGVFWGDETLHMGPTLSGGWTLFGLGGLARFQPQRLGKGQLGLEARAQVFVPSAPAAEFTMGLTWQFGDLEP